MTKKETFMPNSQTEMSAFAERCQTHEYFLPSEREYVRVQDASYPTQIIDIMHMCDEKIYQMFGVPVGMFTNTGAHLQSNYMQVYSLNVNIRRMLSQVQKFLQESWILAEKLTLERIQKQQHAVYASKSKPTTSNERRLLLDLQL